MATSFQIHSILPYPAQPARIRRSDPIRTNASSSSSNWWTPLFGWPAEPDYITKSGSDTEPVRVVSDPDGSKVRFTPGGFTEEKARELRRKTRETAAFHDVMYHSAIASRLVSDVSDP